MKRILVLVIASWGLFSSPVWAQVMPHSVLFDGSDQQFLGQQAGPMLYWANPGENSLQHSTPDGRNLGSFVEELKGPYGLAYDRDNRRLVWTSSGDEVVKTLDADGRQNTLDTSFEQPFAIVKDMGDHYVIYSLERGELTMSVQYDTSEEIEKTNLIVLEGRIRGIALDADNRTIYIGDQYGRMVKRFNLATNKLTALEFGEVNLPLRERSGAAKQQGGAQ